MLLRIGAHAIHAHGLHAARALVDGRLSPSIDDVVEMAEPILKHRMALTFAARADGESVEAVIGKLKTRIG